MMIGKFSLGSGELGIGDWELGIERSKHLIFTHIVQTSCLSMLPILSQKADS
ncbi:MAG: hypothetical protein F6K47_25595 [Symploca sp. SIO2E6]|nr:hypothetical protein [Symploca sp. SIO2E6]